MMKTYFLKKNIFNQNCYHLRIVIYVFIFFIGTRESAFVHAISSAGVAHALTRACSSGDLENCGCDRSLRGMSPEGFQVSLITITIGLY